MSQISNKFIQAASGSSTSGVTDDKIRLRNNQPLRARNAANSADVNILSVSASDVITMAGVLSMGSNKITNLAAPSAASNDAATTNYVDAAIVTAAGANKTLSNLTNPTSINQALLPSGDNTRDIGSSSLKWSFGYFGNGISTISNAAGFSADNVAGTKSIAITMNNTGISFPSGNTVIGYIRGQVLTGDNPFNIGMFTENNSVNSSSATGGIYIDSGNKSAGTGNSGDIKLTTGTSAGGTRGSVYVKPELRIEGTTSGYVGIKAVAAPTSHTLILPSAQGSAGTILTNDGSGNLSWGSAGGSGTVTSVALSAPAIFSVAGSPITTSGTLAISYSGTALPIANGGTNSTTALNNNRIMISSGGAIVETAAITANRALASDSGGLPVASTTTDTELGYVSGVTSAIQTQLGTKLNLSGGTMSGAIAMGTNKITGMGDPTSAQDAATKAYVDNVAAGLKPKAAVRVATTTAGTLASSFENGDTIDGVVLATGNRILIKDQASTSENGIYTVNASGAPTRATDFDSVTPIDEINGAYTLVQFGTANAGTGWVESATVVTVGTDPIVFQQFTAPSSVIGGDMITVSGSTISVDLASTSGLESTNPGNVAGQLRAKVDASTVKINGSNQLESLKPKQENLTLNGTDITNQYKDLAFAIYGTSASDNSAVLSVVGGPIQLKGTDYTVSLTGGAGGVTRITFAGDLATGGAAALISGDILMVSYSYLT